VEASVGAKWLELLKEIAPHVTRVAFIFNPDNPGPMQLYESAEMAASNLAVELVQAPVHQAAEIEATIAMIGREPGGALIVPPDGFLVRYRKLLLDLATHYRLPAIYGFSFFAAEGGLASYGINFSEQFRQAAVYVDRIPARRESRRPPGATADKIRAGHKPPDREGARPPSAIAFATVGRRGHRVTVFAVWK
jgi:putative ABC transport system substrate-binding protein